MSDINFFDKFWKPYLEYEALTGFCENQQTQEIVDLDIARGDVIANIGINWGHSMQIIFEKYPDIKHIYAVDSSTTMLDLAKATFSEDDSKIQKWYKNLSSIAKLFLENLHNKAKDYNSRITFITSSAKEFYSQNITVDKIAATMGFHWLEEPQTEAFISMNKSLPLDGSVTFSTASARFEVNEPEKCFHQNPYYRSFFELFDKAISKISPQERVEIKQYNLDYVKEIIEKAGFELEKYREHKMNISEELIDEVCIAGIKFSYDCDTQNAKIEKLIKQALSEVKSQYKYADSPAQLEVCPIFKIRKVRDV